MSKGFLSAGIEIKYREEKSGKVKKVKYSFDKGAYPALRDTLSQFLPERLRE